MNRNISIVAPVKKPSDIENFSKNSKCKKFYVYHHKFLSNNFTYIDEFIKYSKESGSKIYVNFKHDISEQDVVQIKRFINYLKRTEIDGIFINSFAILEAIKAYNLPFEIIIDSYFEIHNISGIEFANTFHKVSQIILTEEIYFKNISKLKKYTPNISLAIDCDNLPWCSKEIQKLNAIDSVIIKGRFESSQEILEGILLIEKILEKPRLFRNHKLPFKHVRKSYYRTNHFSGEVMCSTGEDFSFTDNIRIFSWDIARCRLKNIEVYKNLKLPRLNLRLSSLKQIKSLGKFIKKLGFNPIYSIEYGEIVNTFDLSKESFNSILNKVKVFCAKYDIRLELSTPRILIERDFDRVYEHVKSLCFSGNFHPESVIVNNIGFFWTLINDSDYQNMSIEIGSGINILNSMSILCLNELHRIETIDFTSFNNFENTKKCINRLKNIILNKKLTIGGNIRIPSLGLCPLNNDSAIVSRLSCKAPCHRGSFAIYDPKLDKSFPFVTDGFCRMHMYDESLVDLFDKTKYLESIGINEFVIDFSDLDETCISKILTRFLNTYLRYSTNK